MKGGEKSRQAAGPMKREDGQNHPADGENGQLQHFRPDHGPPAAEDPPGKLVSRQKVNSWIPLDAVSNPNANELLLNCQTVPVPRQSRGFSEIIK
jgi:hypothetical protein